MKTAVDSFRHLRLPVMLAHRKAHWQPTLSVKPDGLKMFIARLVLLMTIAIYSKAGFGQVTYVFQNFRISPALDAPVFDFAGNRLSGTNFEAQLYGGPTIDSLTPATFGLSTMPAIVPFTAIHSGQAGYFSANTYATITNVFCAPALLWLQVRAWDARLGATYEDVASLGIGGYGESSLFQAAGGTPCSLPIPPGLLIGLQSFSLSAEVPEPSIWLLLMMGLPVFLLGRRVKK